MTGSFQAGNRVAKSTASERVRGLVLNGETYRESSSMEGASGKSRFCLTNEMEMHRCACETDV